MDGGQPRNGYRDLDAWKRAVTLTETVYELVEELPRVERWVWEVQLKKSASGVSRNIAEGYGTGTWRNFRRHVRIARGSAMELQSDLLSIERLDLVPGENIDACLELVDDTIHLVSGFERYITRRLEQ